MRRPTQTTAGEGGWGGAALRRAGAFTLIEFIVVMALLATLMALVAPRLSGSLRRRNLEQEAARWVALTEYGRDQAISDGVPMVIWINADTAWFGLQPKAGWPARAEAPVEFQLPEDIQFDLGMSRRLGGVQEVIEFAPDGYLETQSLSELWLRDRSDDRVAIVRMTNDWGYEVLNEMEYENRVRMPTR